MRFVCQVGYLQHFDNVNIKTKRSVLTLGPLLFMPTPRS